MATSIQLTPEIERRLDALISRFGGKKDDYLKQLMENGIEDLEDYCSATEVMERVRQGKEKVYSTNSVRKELGLDN